MKFKFIHTSDIHLGSILHINGSSEDEKIKHLRKVTYNAFAELCKAACDNDARFIVISGDLFDNDYRSVYADRFFADRSRELEERGIDIIVISGNHDPSGEHRSLFKLPENVHFLSSEEPEVYNVYNKGEPMARIVGQSYKYKSVARPLHKSYPEPDGNIFNIGMLHTQLEPNDRRYVPCTMQELTENRSIHYWALGHIHKPIVLNLNNPVIGYPGTPQGRDFGEEGICGCYLVEVEDAKVTSMEFLPLSLAVYKRVEIDIGTDALINAESLTDLEEYIYENVIRNIARSDIPDRISGLPVRVTRNPEAYILQLILKGRGNLNNLLRQDDNTGNELAEVLNGSYSGDKPFIWIDSVEIHTGNRISVDAVLERQPAVKELLDRLMDGFLNDEEVKSGLMSSLGRMWYFSDDYEGDDELKLRMDSDTYRSILEDAKRMVLEGMAEGKY